MCSSAACNAQEAITTADLRGQICECLWHFAVIDAGYLSVWRHEAELGRCFSFPVYFRAKLCSRDRFSVRLVGKIRRLCQFLTNSRSFFHRGRCLWASECCSAARSLLPWEHLCACFMQMMLPRYWVWGTGCSSTESHLCPPNMNFTVSTKLLIRLMLVGFHVTSPL